MMEMETRIADLNTKLELARIEAEKPLPPSVLPFIPPAVEPAAAT